MDLSLTEQGVADGVRIVARLVHSRFADAEDYCRRAVSSVTASDRRAGA